MEFVFTFKKKEIDGLPVYISVITAITELKLLKEINRDLTFCQLAINAGRELNIIVKDPESFNLYSIKENK